MGQPDHTRPGTASTSPSALGSASATSTRPASNPLGMASLIVAIILVVLSTLRSGTNVLLPYLVQRLGASYGLLIGLPTIMLGVVALIGVVVGVVALLQRGRRRTSAIIGVAIGASWLVTLVGGQILSVIVAAVVASGM